MGRMSLASNNNEDFDGYFHANISYSFMPHIILFSFSGYSFAAEKINENKTIQCGNYTYVLPDGFKSREFISISSPERLYLNGRREYKYRDISIISCVKKKKTDDREYIVDDIGEIVEPFSYKKQEGKYYAHKYYESPTKIKMYVLGWNKEEPPSVFYEYLLEMNAGGAQEHIMLFVRDLTRKYPRVEESNRDKQERAQRLIESIKPLPIKGSLPSSPVAGEPPATTHGGK